MPGKTNLSQLLATLSPAIAHGEFAFVTFPNARYGDHADLAPIASFAEPEGLTLVVPRDLALAHNLEVGTAFACIALGVHSSLDAVGLTAAVAGRLADHGISANVVAAYFHDHVFVPSDRADEALAVLRALATNPAGET